MRTRLLDVLCCPDCRSEALALSVFAGDGQVTEGVIECKGCRASLPIIGGVPRLLPATLRSSLVTYHREFFARYPRLAPAGAAAASDAVVARTLHGYSYQYRKLERPNEQEVVRWRQNLLDSITAGPEFFRGKFGLDVGCGGGRHLYCAHEFGAEMVGIDLSEGVEVAAHVTSTLPRAHIVQADIYHLPFRPETFDFAYSIGVLHHTPRPRESFEHLLPLIKHGGTTMIWVYGLRGMRAWYRLSHMTWIRDARKLPLPIQHGLAIAMAGALEIGYWAPCRLVAALPGGATRVEKLPLADARGRSFTAKVRSVFDRLQPAVTHYHTGEELTAWFTANGLREVSVVNRAGRGWTAAGVKIASAVS
jgi:uncharacterized protein YbaR (Trm112 family)/SAM-dependent methyltransferase